MTGTPTPTIIRTMPACPRCGSTHVKTRSSRPYDYGSRLAYANCRCCGVGFKIVWELPDAEEKNLSECADFVVPDK